ncbi:hypothetical protein [Bdellovibrio sp. HCB209]|uniref:hypothetical protein n=1 Tax=Bdellovibrio sp. HCB209 TaxID=3394354 RepID=UPI0039B557FA
MKSVKSLSIIAVLSLGFAACSSNKSDEKSTAAIAETLSGESLHCENVEIVSMPATDGKSKPVKMKYETLIDATRFFSVDGTVEKTADKGTKTFKVYVETEKGEFELSSSAESVFESEDSKTATTLENGDVKEVGIVKATHTSGSEPQLTENSYEQIVRTKDGVKKIVYKLVDGAEVPSPDIETTEKVEEGIKTISSILKTPFVEQSSNVTTESSSSICTVKKQ